MNKAEFAVWDKKFDYKRGFFMTFANGWKVSVQFSWGNYCANYECEMDITPFTCKDAEVAVFNAAGDWATDEIFPEADGEQVVGYITPDRLADAIMEIKAK